MAPSASPVSPWRSGAAAVAAVGLLCSLAAGCGAAHKRAGVAPAVTTPGPLAGVPGSTTTSSTVARSGSSAGSAVAVAHGPTTTVARPSPGPSQSSGSAAVTNGAPSPAAPGTYTVDQSGSVTGPGFSSNEPPQGTLVIDPVQSNGVQVSHRYVDPKNPPADADVQYTQKGPFMLSETEAGPQGNTTCTFNPPIAAPPWPPAAGDTFSSQGNCGSFTIAVQGRVTGTQSVTLEDGETFTVWVIDSTLSISGQVTGSGTQVDWYSPVVRLPLHEQVDISGSYGAFDFKLHSVSDLVSSHPS